MFGLERTWLRSEERRRSAGSPSDGSRADAVSDAVTGGEKSSHHDAFAIAASFVVAAIRKELLANCNHGQFPTFLRSYTAPFVAGAQA